jgi:hypothetical protein
MAISTHCKPLCFRLFPAVSGCIRVIGRGEGAKFKVSSFEFRVQARVGTETSSKFNWNRPLGLAWARLARGCREKIFARERGGFGGRMILGGLNGRTLASPRRTWQASGCFDFRLVNE